jgi:hypothetical protein
MIRIMVSSPYKKLNQFSNWQHAIRNLVIEQSSTFCLTYSDAREVWKDKKKRLRENFDLL